MANKRRDSKKNSKIHHVRRRRSAREPTMSACMHSRSRGEGLRKMRRYIQKALDFGVESGYLIPKDAAYRVLRVSSDLMNDGNYMSKVKHSARGVSQDRDKTPRQTPIRFEEYEVQDARRRRSGRRRRRSRSGSRRRRRSRKRGRRRRRSDTDEIIENDDNYEFDNQDENRRNTEHAVRKDETERKASNDEKTTDKSGEDGSDLSVDEEESDEDEGKKGNDETQS
ncbi:U1 small nuclear ribonucleoprotein 70 kDa-like [Hylaeus anthracinus]|uniref:U1 small nuclear ribonucleoprotein 70 kDa-like n=1 Tax=Hylaeus anthracinus TaxID=313031 RepID=UPI0023BA151B|nr:U1 small nuclear ribonucleoprotein 70 kDa-like [Hylaeus anthracinus]